jgi:hypothetical protein
VHLSFDYSLTDSPQPTGYPTTGWNIFLSWQNNRLNHKLELLAEEATRHALTSAQKVEEEGLQEAKAELQKIESGAESVAGRMSWA